MDRFTDEYGIADIIGDVKTDRTNGNESPAMEALSAALDVQVRQGQAEVHLPIMGIDAYGPGGKYEALGFKIGSKVTNNPKELFINVQLPLGWTKRPSGQSMHTDIVDDKGRRRASFFYKAAFYDCCAHMYAPIPRYRVTIGPNDCHNPLLIERVVIDTDLATYDSTGKVCDAAVIYRISGRLESGQKRYLVAGLLEKTAQDWLDQHYPDNQNVLAYWD